MNLTFLTFQFQIGNLFMSKRSTVIAIYNGAIDSSGIVLLCLKVHNFKVLISMRIFLQAFFIPANNVLDYPLIEVAIKYNKFILTILLYRRKIESFVRTVTMVTTHLLKGSMTYGYGRKQLKTPLFYFILFYKPLRVY